MSAASVSTAGVLIAAVLAGGVLAGCSSGDSSSPSSASSSPSTSAASSSATVTSSAERPSAADGAQDYSNLLIKASDIDPSFAETGAPILNPNGVPGVGTGFTNVGKKETIYDTIVVTDGPGTAAAGLQGLKDSLGSSVTGTPEPADIGIDGFIATGTNPEGTNETTIVAFSTESNAVVHLEFESEPGDPIAADIALQVAKMQLEAVDKGLAG